MGVHEPLTEGAIIHQGFKDQVEQKVDGWYKTGFIWKPNKDLLPDNKEGSISVFHMPHKPVIRQNAWSKKVKIAYDASARATPTNLSLNDCLETGPALLNLLWSILIRSRFCAIVLCWNIEKAFLQIAIKKKIKMCFDSIGFTTEI